MKEAENKVIKIAAKIMWAYLDKPSQMSGAYQVDLCDLSSRAVEALEDIGVVARSDPNRPEKGFFITCKSKYPIVALDKDGDEVRETVGNGSEAVALVSGYSWKFKNKSGVSPSIRRNGLTITKLVEYIPDDVDDVPADDDEAL